MTGSDIGGEYFGKILVTVQCDAPDPQAAKDIVEEKTTEWETETVRNYEKLLQFQWDYDEGMWEMEDLIKYLKDRHCTSIEYAFHGTHYTRTEHYPVDD